jgi:hypothetical protein
MTDPSWAFLHLEERVLLTPLPHRSFCLSSPGSDDAVACQSCFFWLHCSQLGAGLLMEVSCITMHPSDFCFLVLIIRLCT